MTRSAARQRSTSFHCRTCQPSTKNGRMPIARESENVLSMFEKYPTPMENTTAHSSGNRSSTR